MPQLPKWRNMLFSVTTLTLLLANWASWTYFLQSSTYLLEIKFLDVGQGDSFLLTTPDNVSLLVDGGRDGNAYEQLKQNLRLAQNIDVVLLSHPDQDHVASLSEVVDNEGPKFIIFNRHSHVNEEYTEFLQSVENREYSLSVYPAVRGNKFRLGCCVVLYIIWPEPIKVKDLEPNDHSIGVLILYKNFSFLSMGDLSSEWEELIAKRLEIQHVDLLKVSHHGSKTSSSADFLAQVSPAVSVIQVGENSYGHPNPDVLDTLNHANTKVFRNDQQGDITYYTDGENYGIRTQK